MKPSALSKGPCWPQTLRRQHSPGRASMAEAPGLPQLRVQITAFRVLLSEERPLRPPSFRAWSLSLSVLCLLRPGPRVERPRTLLLHPPAGSPGCISHLQGRIPTPSALRPGPLRSGAPGTTPECASRCLLPVGEALGTQPKPRAGGVLRGVGAPAPPPSSHTQRLRPGALSSDKSLPYLVKQVS